MVWGGVGFVEEHRVWSVRAARETKTRKSRNNTNSLMVKEGSFQKESRGAER